MRLPRRRFLELAAGVAALPAASRIARAQTYPSRPVTLIVPYAAGGPTDTPARIIAERMRAALGQSVIIENVSGGGGTIGVGRAARAAGDGYTLTTGQNSTHILNGALYALPYDVVKDFEPISPTVKNSFVIVAKKTMPARTLTELIGWLKTNPNKASAGDAGVGVGRIVAVFFQKETGTQFQILAYRGNSAAMQDLVAGQIDMMFTDPISSVPQLRAGTVKAYAVTAKSRLAIAPDIPTVDEAGLPGLYASGWYGLFAPKGTPKDVIAKLNAAVVDALADPAVRSRITDLGLEIYPREQQTPEALAALQKAEIEKWWPIIKAAGIKPE
jgi:tripartite-type tricarboxylate transporter receptor subunit TctC